MGGVADEALFFFFSSSTTSFEIGERAKRAFDTARARAVCLSRARARHGERAQARVVP